MRVATLSVPHRQRISPRIPPRMPRPEFVRFWAGDSGRDLLVSPTLEVSPTPRIPPRMPPRMLAEHRWAAFWAATRPEAAAQNPRNSGRDRSGRRSGRRGLSGRPSLCALHGLCTTVSDVFLLHGVLGRKTQARLCVVASQATMPSLSSNTQPSVSTDRSLPQHSPGAYSTRRAPFPSHHHHVKQWLSSPPVLSLRVGCPTPCPTPMRSSGNTVQWRLLLG